MKDLRAIVTLRSFLPSADKNDAPAGRGPARRGGASAPLIRSCQRRRRITHCRRSGVSERNRPKGGALRGDGAALPTPTIEMPKGGAGQRPAEPKKKDTLTACLSFWWRLLDSNQWPHACEDPYGHQMPAIRRFPVLLAPFFQNRQEVMVHCVHPLLSGYWSAYWSNHRLRSLSGAGDSFRKWWPCFRDGSL